MRFFFSRLCMTCKKGLLFSKTTTVVAVVSKTTRAFPSLAQEGGFGGEQRHTSPSAATGAVKHTELPEFSGALPSLAGKPPTNEVISDKESGTIEDNAAFLAAVDCVRAVLRDRSCLPSGAAGVATLTGPAFTLLTPVAQCREEKEGKKKEDVEMEEKSRDDSWAKNSENVSAALAVLLEKDADLSHHLLASLSGDSLRLLLVVATALEYFGQDAVEAQLRVVDKDRDDNISSQDYNAWINTAVRERAARRFVMPLTPTRTSDTAAITNTSPHTITNTHTIAQRNDFCHVSWGLWNRIALSAAIPFMAFGVLDNAIFVTVGDAIDKSFADTFNLSTMAAAALGGVVSGTAGIQMHGIAVRLTQKSRLAQLPKLTAAQHASASCLSATRVGNIVGLVVGLLFGMTPLLFLSPSAS